MRAQQVLILTDHPQTQSQFQWTDGLIFAFSAKLKISTKKKKVLPLQRTSEKIPESMRDNNLKFFLVLMM